MGQVTHVSISLREVRQREFRRMLVASLVAHCLVVVSLMFRPSPGPMTLPGVVTVDLVAAPAAPAAPAPARPAAPPKPVVKKVVLPKEPTAPKPKPKPAKVEKPAPPPEPEVVEQDYADVMEELRAAAGETEQPAETAAPAPPGGGGGVGVPVSPEVAAWVRQAKIHVRRVWVLPPAFRTQALEAHVRVELDAGGNVIGAPEVVRRSGNPWYDEGVVRAIQKASPLPPPPAAGDWAFVFVPGDSY